MAHRRAADVSTPQCLVDFYDDEEEYYWHHRLLLYRAGEHKWIWATPTLEVQLGDLSLHRVVPLRRAETIHTSYASNAYLFGPVPPVVLQDMMERGRALAYILGVSVADISSAADRWFVSDPRHEAFGEEVPAECLATEKLMLKRDDVGLVQIDGSWTLCVRVAARRTFADFQAELAEGVGRDPRLLGDSRVKGGRRFLSFDDAIERSSPKDLPGFPLPGPRVGKSFMASLRSAGQTYTSHHTDFIRKSGVAEKSSAAREHRHGHEILRLLCEYDQIDPSNSCAAEYLTRRLIQIESAVRRNARRPDFEGLDALLDTSVDEGGAAVVAEFATWVAERQKAEAQTLKAGRQWRDERAADNKKNADPRGGNKKNGDKGE